MKNTDFQFLDTRFHVDISKRSLKTAISWQTDSIQTIRSIASSPSLSRRGSLIFRENSPLLGSQLPRALSSSSFYLAVRAVSLFHPLGPLSHSLSDFLSSTAFVSAVRIDFWGQLRFVAGVVIL